MKKLTIKNVKINKKVATPIGRLMWMHLAEPKPATDTMQPDKYTCTVAWDPNDKGQEAAARNLTDAILEVARQAYGDNTITMQDLKDNNALSVIKDGGSMQDYLKGLYVTSASTSSKYPPKVYGPVMAQGEMSKEDITKLSQGDYGRMVITIAPYYVQQLKRGGLTAYLSIVQFARKGDYLGGGSDGKSLLDDLNVEAVNEDEQALLDAMPLQDKKEEVKEEPAKASSSEPKEEDEFNDLFNF